MASQEELFASVDVLLAEEPQLPTPAERARLREAAGVTQARLAQALKTTQQTVTDWEHGRSEPRPPRPEAYQRLPRLRPLPPRPSRRRRPSVRRRRRVPVPLFRPRMRRRRP
ncbi:helix-turn-helix domain-containing protein [Streptomyces hyaluromycini]|uniref:helix-turn-helix domain-containing protein n=1 Tax=Streptomyces hyaluromycini TaxID=1377993 RepID=UPI000D1B9C54|nr:helix-turn-helix domain-containing protein [Streptomyces hyaluromycini]